MKGSVIVRFGAVRLMRMSMRVLMNMLGVLSDDWGKRGHVWRRDVNGWGRVLQVFMR